jgi:uncharacterized protein
MVSILPGRRANFAWFLTHNEHSMQTVTTLRPVPVNRLMAVLIGFPAMATLISLLLLKRTLITDLGLDFFNTFWIIITGWYLVQIYLVSKILSLSGWTWEHIGFSFKNKQFLYLFGGYLLFSAGLVIFIEMALSHAPISTEDLNKISSLTSKTTTARIIFVVMGFVAGLTEEIVYRGFAIQALTTHRINKWLAVVIASIPFIFQHGLKSTDQFWWFLSWGIVLGVMYLWLKKLYVNILLHWLIILSAMVAILQAIG